MNCSTILTDRKIIISIIVPVYNVGKYLKECLCSLVNQDLSKDEYEIICINDGSTDGSGAILESFSSKYDNIYVFHQKNCGVSASRNKGIELSRGEYVWFVDSDDLIARNCLLTVSEILKKSNPDLLFVKPIAFDDGDDKNVYECEKISENETTKQYVDWLWTRFIKREIIENSGVLFDSRVSYAEDHLFCTMLNPYIKNILHHNQVVYCYRRRQNSLSTTPTKNKLDILIRAAEVFKERGENNTIDDEIAMREVCVFMVSVMSAIAMLPKQESKNCMLMVKSKKLFPLKKQKCYKPEYDLSGLSLENKLLTKLKHKAYTFTGYYLFIGYRKLLKIKRRFIH